MKVALFITCINDTLFPNTGIATVKLLERLGVDVLFPQNQSCCGQMHYNTGYRKETGLLAKKFIKDFQNYDAIVVPSASCGGTPFEYYKNAAESLGDKKLAEDAKKIIPKVYELTYFITDVLKVTDVGAYFPHKVTYHPTCHSLRAVPLGKRPFDLLKNVKGLEFIDLESADECCGFGGTFAVKNAAVSAAMVSDKAQHVLDSGANILAAVDNSCLMNIAGKLAKDGHPIRSMHIAEILANTFEDGPIKGIPLAKNKVSA